MKTNLISEISYLRGRQICKKAVQSSIFSVGESCESTELFIRIGHLHSKYRFLIPFLPLHKSSFFMHVPSAVGFVRICSSDGIRIITHSSACTIGISKRIPKASIGIVVLKKYGGLSVLLLYRLEVLHTWTTAPGMKLKKNV